MQILESSVERAVVQWARERNIQSIKLNLQGRRAYPDRLFWINGGRPALIEFKRPGHKTTPLQAHTLGILKELHYDVYVADNKKDACRFLENCASQAHKKTT